MSHATPNSLADRTLVRGALAWVAISAAAVAIRGVRWEETWEHALIITRSVAYPEGHPMFLYCRNVFSGQSYLSALVLHFVDSALFINGLRNALQLAFCTVPVFLLGARFAGTTRAGHAAATLVLLGIHRGFQSYYPIETWPHFYSVGQIGLGYALLCLAFLACGWLRAAWFLLGLMPAVHIGQWPVAGAVAGLHWLYLIGSGHRAKALTLAGWFGAGLLPCLLFAAVLHFFRVAPPESGAYAATGDVHAIWAAYSEQHDIHRFVARLNPPWKSAIGAALALVLSAGALLHRRGSGRMPYAWAAVYAGIAIVVAGGIGLLHHALGSNTPFLLIGWMPYRLPNHLAVLLVPLAAGLLLGPARPRAGMLVVAIVMFYAALYPVWRLLLPEPLFSRYAGNPEGLLFALFGAAFAALSSGAWAPRWTFVAAAVLGGALAFLFPFGLAAALGGAMAWFALAWCLPEGPQPPAPPRFGVLRCTLTAATLAVLVSLLVGQWRHRESLPRQPIHDQVCQYLADRGEDQAMLLTPYWDVEWLGKTRHPILADYQTAHLMTYMPSLGPVLKKLHEEAFGFLLDGETGPPLAPWPDRSPEEWRRLGRDYGFAYLLAPAEMTLHLERVLEGQPYDLYRIGP